MADPLTPIKSPLNGLKFRVPVSIPFEKGFAADHDLEGGSIQFRASYALPNGGVGLTSGKDERRLQKSCERGSSVNFLLYLTLLLVFDLVPSGAGLSLRGNNQ